jgi:hypothetical protein
MGTNLHRRLRHAQAVRDLRERHSFELVKQDGFALRSRELSARAPSPSSRSPPCPRRSEARRPSSSPRAAVAASSLAPRSWRSRTSRASRARRRETSRARAPPTGTWPASDHPPPTPPPAAPGTGSAGARTSRRARRTRAPRPDKTASSTPRPSPVTRLVRWRASPLYGKTRRTVSKKSGGADVPMKTGGTDATLVATPKKRPVNANVGVPSGSLLCRCR